MARFHLSKYYLDCVTDDGAGCIAYVARLHWGPLRLRYAALLEWPAGGQVRERHAFGRVAPPQAEGDVLHWSCARLAVRAHWHGAEALPAATLFDGPAGRIDWQVLAPRARARLERTGQPALEGWGYGERLDMTVKPWHLPFDTLSWGRFHSPADALVWIAWDGETTLRHIIHNGELLDEAEVAERSLHFGGDRELLLAHTFTLRDAPVAAALERLPRVLRRVPPTFLAAREVKWLSQARLSNRRVPPASGWALHEWVRFR